MYFREFLFCVRWIILIVNIYTIIVIFLFNRQILFYINIYYQNQIKVIIYFYHIRTQI